jgi:hypothetical protein
LCPHTTELTFSSLTMNKWDLRVWMTDIWLQFCALQHQHLHLSPTVTSIICCINLVSTDSESYNSDSYPPLLVLKILEHTYFHIGIIWPVFSPAKPM